MHAVARAGQRCVRYESLTLGDSQNSRLYFSLRGHGPLGPAVQVHMHAQQQLAWRWIGGRRRTCLHAAGGGYGRIALVIVILISTIANYPSHSTRQHARLAEGGRGQVVR
jgi:hypothetical protein